MVLSRAEKRTIRTLLPLASLTVMLVPQGLAYATLAGMPPQYGVYASCIGLLIYPLFSTSPHMAVGPVALASLLNEATLTGLGLVPEDKSAWILASLQLAFITGLVQLLLGVFRAGSLVKFLSHSMLQGFTAGGSIIIASSQFSKLFNVKIPRSEYVWKTWVELISVLHKSHGPTMVLSVITIAAFALAQFGKKRAVKSIAAATKAGRKVPAWASIVKQVPWALVIVFATLIIMEASGLHETYNLKVVGSLSNGFPAPVNVFDATFGERLGTLIPSAAVLALVTYMESISVAKALAAKSGDNVDSSQELSALGLANIVGAPFNTFIVTGGFSRSSVNADAGAKTPAAGFISGLLLLLIILFMMPVFYALPAVTLAVLIIFAVVKLIDLSVPKELWHIQRSDFWVWVCTFIGTLALGIEVGIFIGAGVSIAIVVARAATPHYALLGERTDGTWRNVKNFPDTERLPGVTALRFDADMFYGNIQFILDTVAKHVVEDWRQNGKPHDHTLLLHMGSCVNIDASAIHALEHIEHQLYLAAMPILLEDHEGEGAPAFPALHVHAVNVLVPLARKLHCLGKKLPLHAVPGAAAGTDAAEAELIKGLPLHSEKHEGLTNDALRMDTPMPFSVYLCDVHTAMRDLKLGAHATAVAPAGGEQQAADAVAVQVEEQLHDSAADAQAAEQDDSAAATDA